MDADAARDRPVRMLESGPAAGALAAGFYSQTAWRAGSDLARHGRNHRQDLCNRRRRAEPYKLHRDRPRPQIQDRQRIAHPHTRPRSDRDRIGRRQHRLARWAGPAPRRPAERGREPGPRLLRAWRRPADGYRRQPHARLPEPGLLPRRTDDARHRRRRARYDGTRRPARHERGRSRLGRVQRSYREHGRRRPHPHNRSQQRPPPLRYRRLWRRRTGARLRSRPHPRRVSCGRAAWSGRNLRARLSRRPALFRERPLRPRSAR